jgi:hypothetical protein
LTLPENEKLVMKPEKAILGIVLASATLTVMAGAIIAPVIRAMIEPLGAPIAGILLLILLYPLLTKFS